jgi:hypothetical protein
MGRRQTLQQPQQCAMAQSAVKPDPVLAVVDPAEPGPESLQAHRAKAWEFFRSIGSPKLHVAPMVDQVSNKAMADILRNL